MLSFITPALVKPVKAFLTSAAIGLLIGMERERLTNAIAGSRNFSLVAVLGSLLAMLMPVHSLNCVCLQLSALPWMMRLLR